MGERGQTEGRRRPLLVAPNLVAQAARGPLGQERESGPDTRGGGEGGEEQLFLCPRLPSSHLSEGERGGQSGWELGKDF